MHESFESQHPNPKKMPLAYTDNELFHKQVLPGAPLEDLTRHFMSQLESTTRWDSFQKSVIAAASSESEKVVSLHQWKLQVLADAAIRSFYGDALPRLLPDINSIFDQWDMNSYMTTYRYPAFVAQIPLHHYDPLHMSTSTTATYSPSARS